MDKSYGELPLKKTQVHEWLERFRGSRARANDDPRWVLPCSASYTPFIHSRWSYSKQGIVCRNPPSLHSCSEKETSGKWTRGSWVLQHNAPADGQLIVQMVVKKYLAEHYVITLKRSSHFLDLSPSDLVLFPRLEVFWKHYDSRVPRKSLQKRRGPWQRCRKNGFQECFQKFYGPWQKRITAQGTYFEVSRCQFT
jgi:hypothetical protein